MYECKTVLFKLKVIPWVRLQTLLYYFYSYTNLEFNCIVAVASHCSVLCKQMVAGTDLF